MRKRILLVEDVPAESAMLRVMLTSLGYETVTASTLKEAVTLSNDYPTDCVLLDPNLPDSKGIDIVEKVINAIPEVPIVVLSSGALTEAEVTAKTGVQEVIAKGNICPKLIDDKINLAITKQQVRPLYAPLHADIDSAEAALDKLKVLSKDALKKCP